MLDNIFCGLLILNRENAKGRVKRPSCEVKCPEVIIGYCIISPQPSALSL
jgi:hypothetical protein